MISGKAIAAALGGKWRGRQAMVSCCAHKDPTPSLHISEAEDGRVLVHCFAGCPGESVIEVLKSRGLWDSGNGADFVPRAPKPNGNGRHKPDAPAVLMPAPSSYGPASFDHPVHGRPVMSWAYLDAKGQILGHICRFEAGDQKQILPRVCTADGWRWAGFPKPRPLYGLDRLAGRPDAPVLIVEGEKSADAATGLCPHHVVITWQGGSSAVDHADWTPLHGRVCLVWPDADEPGAKAGKRLKSLVRNIGAGEVKVLDPATHATKKGWDAADALAEGWTPEQIQRWFSPPPAPRHTEPTSPLERRLTLGLELDKYGQPVANLSTARLILEGDRNVRDIVWWDEFLSRIMTNRDGVTREWSDIDDINLTGYMQTHYGIHRLGKEMVSHAVKAHAHAHRKHCVRDWLDTLKWDGVDRMQHCFTEHFGAKDDEYTRAVSRNFFVGMVARIYQPGCKLDNMVIFEGGQGLNKSSALNLLAGDWFAEQHESVMGKGFFEVLQGVWLVEISEMDVFTRAEISKVKGVVSCRKDRYRPSYGHHAEDHPRQCAFVGSWNKDAGGVFNDETGARRFWPVAISGEVNLQALERDRSQLFAEARAAFKAGAKWWEVPKTQAELEQSARYIDDIWHDNITAYCAGRKSVTIAEILLDRLNIKTGDQNRAHQMRAASCLKRLNWQRKQSTDGTWKYVSPTFPQPTQATDPVG